MPLPGNFQTITLDGSYVDLTGAAPNGSIQFDIEDAVTALLDPSADTIVLRKSITASIAAGTFSVTLPTTNDPDIVPSFTYKVTENFPTLSVTRTYYITIPYNSSSPLHLADLVPSDTPSGGSGTMALVVQDEGSTLSSTVSQVNFTGAGVTASGSGSSVTVNVPVPTSTITVQEEGSTLSSSASQLNFTGTGVTASGSGSTITVNVPSGASALTVKDEGTNLTTSATSIDFTGAGVTATNTSGAVTVSVPSVTVSEVAFAVVYPGTTTVAIKYDGTTISSSTNASTVINAAITAAGAVANGGPVQLGGQLFTDLPSQISIPSSAAGVHLLGAGGTKDRPSSDNPIGTVLRPSAGFTDAQLISIGGSGASGHAGGCRVAGLSLDTNANSKQIHGIKGFNAQDLIVERCVLLGPGQSVTNKRGIFLNSDQATNSGSGAEPRIRHNWFRNWDSAIYAGTVNGQDGETATSVGLTDGHINENDSWTCRRSVILHHGGWMMSGNHWVGNSTTDFHLQTDSQVQSYGDYFDSVKVGGYCVELQVGCVGAILSAGHYIIGGDATSYGVRWTAQRNKCLGSNFTLTGTGGSFLKFTNAGNGGHIVGNTGAQTGGGGTDADIVKSSTGTGLGGWTGTSGAGFGYAQNIFV